jgi:hypothetical protein
MNYELNKQIKRSIMEMGCADTKLLTETQTGGKIKIQKCTDHAS